MDFTVRKLTPNVGAEISGLDLRQPLDADTMAEVRKVWLDNVVVVFPEQALDDDQQIAFSRRVGELEMINMSALQLPGRPEIYAATNLDENDELMAPDHPVMQVNYDNRKWHSDSSFKRVPAMASLLHARIVPPTRRRYGLRQHGRRLRGTVGRHEGEARRPGDGAQFLLVTA